MAARVRKGDFVIIIAGKDKGKTGIIKEVIIGEDNSKVIIDGLNLATCFNKKTKEGITKKAMPIHVSNVMHYDSNLKIRTRVCVKTSENGKELIAKCSGKKIRGI